MRRYARTMKALGDALGITKARVSQLKNGGKLPPPGPMGWDVEQCRALLAARKGSKVTASTTKIVKPDDELPPSGDEQELVVRLRKKQDSYAEKLIDPDLDPRETARLAMQAAAALLAGAIQSRTVTSREFDSLKKTLEELRRSESDYLELARRQGELVPRDVAAQVAAQVAVRAVAALARVEVSLAQQVSIWFEDRNFARLPIGDRVQVVRKWFGEQVAQVRNIEAREIERMIQAELTDE